MAAMTATDEIIVVGLIQSGYRRLLLRERQNDLASCVDSFLMGARPTKLGADLNIIR